MSDWLPELDSVPYTRHGYVLNHLREAILRGHLKPGEKLDQHDIARVFNVSRSPVRAALLSLAAEGLVKHEPHRGAVVSELSAEEVEEIYLIRKVLEGIAARLAAPNMTDERIEKLRAVQVQLESTEDPDDWVTFNQEFHNLIYEAARRPRLYALIQTLSNTALPYTRQFYDKAERLQIARRSHRCILEACERRDAEAAQKASEEHLEEVSKSMLANWDNEVAPSMKGL